MTRLLFIRHGAIDGLGLRIAGRQPGNELNRAGFRQAAQLARRLRSLPIAAIYSSPQARAQQTAQALAAAVGVDVATLTELDELDFGEWTGRSYEELNKSDEWRAYNNLRSVIRLPRGELLLEVQNRIITCAERLRRDHTGQTVALVSHGDVIRAALAYYLGTPLDFLLRFEISPASFSTVELSDGGPRVLAINQNFGECEGDALGDYSDSAQH